MRVRMILVEGENEQRNEQENEQGNEQENEQGIEQELLGEGVD